MTSYDEYLAAVLEALAGNPNLRVGQAVINVLWDLDQTVAEELHSSEVNPFYKDAFVPAFLARVKEAMGGDHPGIRLSKHEIGVLSDWATVGGDRLDRGPATLWRDAEGIAWAKPPQILGEPYRLTGTSA